MLPETNFALYSFLNHILIYNQTDEKEKALMDIFDIHAFYKSPLGAYARGEIVRHLQFLWPDLQNQLLVIGAGQSLARAAWKNHITQKAVYFTPHNLSGETGMVTIDESLLPLRDNSVNQIFVAHGLEFAAHPELFLYELNRILVPQGRAILVIPNRMGSWVRHDKTPFGAGQPFSYQQLKRLLTAYDFSLINKRVALMLPPYTMLYKLSDKLHLVRAYERFFQLTLPAFSGILIVEIRKTIFARPHVQPYRRAAPRFIARPAFGSSPSSFTGDKG